MPPSKRNEVVERAVEYQQIARAPAPAASDGAEETAAMNTHTARPSPVEAPPRAALALSLLTTRRMRARRAEAPRPRGVSDRSAAALPISRTSSSPSSALAFPARSPPSTHLAATSWRDVVIRRPPRNPSAGLLRDATTCWRPTVLEKISGWELDGRERVGSVAGATAQVSG